MATYTVKPKQNIFDIATFLHGSIEGVFDLLISNPGLSMTTDFKGGEQLQYHEYYKLNDGIIQVLQSDNITPINSERCVYYKEPVHELKALIEVLPETPYIKFTISGENTIIIDWGDNSLLETVELQHTERTISHYFDNKINEEKRIVKLYGDFTILRLTIDKLPGIIYPVRSITVDEVIIQNYLYPFPGLHLFEGTIYMDLQYTVIEDLSPLLHMHLQTLDLRGAVFVNANALDSYLVGLVENYDDRRNCEVKLTTEPGPEGMQAIQTIINEPAWNSSGAWVFNINGIIYTYIEDNG